MELKRKEIAAYVRNNVEFYEQRLQLALGWMERSRCPLRMADGALYDAIVGAIEDWCWDNDVNYDELDFEELIEGNEGIIWEE